MDTLTYVQALRVIALATLDIRTAEVTDLGITTDIALAAIQAGTGRV